MTTDTLDEAHVDAPRACRRTRRGREATWRQKWPPAAVKSVRTRATKGISWSLVPPAPAATIFDSCYRKNPNSLRGWGAIETETSIKHITCGNSLAPQPLGQRTSEVNDAKYQ